MVLAHDIRESPGDPRLAKDVVAALAQQGVTATAHIPQSALEAKQKISATQLCVSARMHACVAALSTGVPCVGIEYLNKFSGQFAWYGRAGAVVEETEAMNIEVSLRAVKTVVHKRKASETITADMIPWLPLLDDMATAK